MQTYSVQKHRTFSHQLDESRYHETIPEDIPEPASGIYIKAADVAAVLEHNEGFR